MNWDIIFMSCSCGYKHESKVVIRGIEVQRK